MNEATVNIEQKLPYLKAVRVKHAQVVEAIDKFQEGWIGFKIFQLLDREDHTVVVLAAESLWDFEHVHRTAEIKKWDMDSK